MPVEVFKTNICCQQNAEKIRGKLIHDFPQSEIHFDLDDCDRILRISGNDFNSEALIRCVNEQGFSCEILQA